MRGFVSLEAGRGTWDAFVPYGGLHLAAVSVCALLVAGLVITARASAAPQEAALRRGFGVFAVAYWIAYSIWWNRHELNPATGLPLHICDLNGFVAPLAILTGRRWLRATLYFWTFALTLQAFIQPTLTHGPAFPVFWFFWAAHSIVVTSAVYDLAVLGFRPQWRDLGRAYAVSALYVAAIVPVDLLLGANYGFSAIRRPGWRSRPLSTRSGRGPCAPSSSSCWEQRASRCWCCRGSGRQGRQGREERRWRPQCAY